MELRAINSASRQVLSVLRRPTNSVVGSNSLHGRLSLRPSRYASSNSSKPIGLEKPEKFRPPSHPSRLKARSTTSAMGGYNQGMTATEKEQSKTKSYPHMFPAPGTRMHWFLTSRMTHFWITMAVLVTLASISMTQTFLQTSPFAHLIPDIKTFPFHPIHWITETIAVYRLHMEYNTAKVAEARRKGILDAQKRRLYRRAHGMEDQEQDEVNGPDVRGLVPWDDGLTNPERFRGGQWNPVISGALMMEMGSKPGENVKDLFERKRKEDADRMAAYEAETRRMEEEEAAEQKRQDELRKPKRKVYFGIWG